MGRFDLSNPSPKKRILLDTNLFISFLLHSERSAPSSIDQIIALTIAGTFHLIVPDAVLSELRLTIEQKPYLNRSIDRTDLDSLIQILETLRLTTPSVPGPYAAVVRDRGDDYLLAHARVLDVDFLVTGDKDLLVLRDLIDRPQIMTVRAFLDFMQDEC